jgi:hypothetical protein
VALKIFDHGEHALGCLFGGHAIISSRPSYGLGLSRPRDHYRTRRRDSRFFFFSFFTKWRKRILATSQILPVFFPTGEGWIYYCQTTVTTEIERFVECLNHSTKSEKHSAQSLSSVILSKESSTNNILATTSLPSTFYRALGKEKRPSRRRITETALCRVF